MSRVRVPEGVPSSKNGEYRLYSCEKKPWPVGQAVKTAASHAANMGSIPVRVTTFFLTEECVDVTIQFVATNVVAIVGVD